MQATLRRYRSPLKAGLHQASVTHDQDTARSYEPEKSAERCCDPEHWDTCTIRGGIVEFSY